MNWALAGQIVTVWLVISVVATPLIGRWLRRRRARSEMQALYRAAVEDRLSRRAIPVRVISGTEQRELEKEQKEFNRTHRPRLSTSEEWAAYERYVLGADDDEAFHLDGPSHPHPRKPAA